MCNPVKKMLSNLYYALGYEIPREIRVPGYNPAQHIEPYNPGGGGGGVDLNYVLRYNPDSDNIYFTTPDSGDQEG